MEKIYLDEEGYQKYQDKILELRKKLNQTASSKTDRTFSRTSENELNADFEVINALEEARKVQRELSEMVSNADRIEIVKKDSEEYGVDISDVVAVRFISETGEKSEDLFKLTAGIIPNMEAYPIEITLQSPLGQALYKKNIGTHGSYKAAGKVIQFEIVQIEKSQIESIGPKISQK